MSPKRLARQCTSFDFIVQKLNHLIDSLHSDFKIWNLLITVFGFGWCFQTNSNFFLRKNFRFDPPWDADENQTLKISVWNRCISNWIFWLFLGFANRTFDKMPRCKSLIYPRFVWLFESRSKLLPGNPGRRQGMHFQSWETLVLSRARSVMPGKIRTHFVKVY